MSSDKDVEEILQDVAEKHINESRKATAPSENGEQSTEFLTTTKLLTVVGCSLACGVAAVLGIVGYGHYQLAPGEKLDRLIGSAQEWNQLDTFLLFVQIWRDRGSPKNIVAFAEELRHEQSVHHGGDCSYDERCKRYSKLAKKLVAFTKQR
jgi:hypothetical protein